jgi:hypothetical protein
MRWHVRGLPAVSGRRGRRRNTREDAKEVDTQPAQQRIESAEAQKSQPLGEALNDRHRIGFSISVHLRWVEHEAESELRSVVRRRT